MAANANTTTLMNPGGQSLLNLGSSANQKMETTVDNASTLKLKIEEANGQNASPKSGTNAQTEAVAEKVLQENKKEEGKSQSDECPTVRFKSGFSKSFTWDIGRVNDPLIRRKMRRLELQRSWQNQQKTDPNIFLYNPSP